MKVLGIMFLVVLILIICRAVCGPEKIHWKGIVVHHSASDFDNFKIIDSYHRSEGWRRCGYHFVIEKDGETFKGRPLTMVGAHAKNSGPDRNRTHIGICLAGNESFTYEQLRALHDLCEKLAEDFSIESIERHHEECPGSGVNVEVLQEEIFMGV